MHAWRLAERPAAGALTLQRPCPLQGRAGQRAPPSLVELSLESAASAARRGRATDVGCRRGGESGVPSTAAHMGRPANRPLASPSHGCFQRHRLLGSQRHRLVQGPRGRRGVIHDQAAAYREASDRGPPPLQIMFQGNAPSPSRPWVAVEFSCRRPPERRKARPPWPPHPPSRTARRHRPPPHPPHR